MKKSATKLPPLTATRLALMALVALGCACWALTGAGVQNTSAQGQSASGGNTLTPAGTRIINRGRLVYDEPDGGQVEGVTPTVEITVAAVNSVSVTPDQDAFSARVNPQSAATALFQICNAGNQPTAYVVSNAVASAPANVTGIYYDADGSGTVTPGDTPVTLSTTASAAAGAGQCVPALVAVQSNDVRDGQDIQITLDARTAPGTEGAETGDSGRVILRGQTQPLIRNPEDPTLPPLKSVNGQPAVTVAQGDVLDFRMAYRNVGGTEAQQVLTVDDLPTGLSYLAGSLRLNDRALTDAEDADEGRVVGTSRVEVRLARVEPQEVVDITFKAVVGQLPNGSLVVNRGLITAANIPPTPTNDTPILINPTGIVYDGLAGTERRVADSSVRLVSAGADDALLPLPTGQGFTPNADNLNPFTTGGDGKYSFGLGANPLLPTSHWMLVEAKGYRPRKFEVQIRQGANSRVFDMAVRSLDGMPVVGQAGPVAVPDGAALAASAQDTALISGLGAVVFDVPMYAEGGIEIAKSVDRSQAEVGDILTYRIDVRNRTTVGSGDLSIRDVLPQSFYYVDGSGTLTVGGSTSTVEPRVEGDAMTFQIGNIPAGGTASLVYRVRIGVNALMGEQFNVAVVRRGDTPVTPPTRTGVVVTGGPFTMRQFAIGRVFIDSNSNGYFDKGDSPVAGARLHTSGGRVVITDSAGNYNLPTLGEGVISLRLDPSTVPEGYRPYDDLRRDGGSWDRLLITPMGGGMMLQQGFALRPVEGSGAQAAGLGANVTVVNSRLADARERASRANAVLAGARGADAVFASARPAPTAMPDFNPAAAAALAAETAGGSKPEPVEAVAPGGVAVDLPENFVVNTPGLNVQVRVADGYSVRLEMNGVAVGENIVGEERLDNSSKSRAFTFIGVQPKPGPNRLAATAVGPDGTAGDRREVTVYGRGPMTKVEMVPERGDISAGRRDATDIAIRALDQWGHPALDGQLVLETTAGAFIREGESLRAPNPIADGALTRGTDLSERPVENERQIVIHLQSGLGVVRLVSSSDPATAVVSAAGGNVKASAEVRFGVESERSILAGYAQFMFGRANPMSLLRNTDSSFNFGSGIFYRGRIPGDNILTFAYDSQRPLNRLDERNRIFQNDPLDYTYKVYGDSSTRYNAAPANTKLYARVDMKRLARSYFLFGDFEPDRRGVELAAYGRRLTGVQVHLEDNQGNYLSLGGARPDTSFARDVIPGGSFGIVKLTANRLVPGSENVTLEVRDRRNPDLIVEREQLQRGIDYNLDASSGYIYLIRPIQTFDSNFNLRQVVVTYEYESDGMSTNVYTARASRKFDEWGLRVGLTANYQNQPGVGGFGLGGVDATKKMPQGGELRFEWARSSGKVLGLGNFFNAGGAGEDHAGNAFLLTYDQPFELGGRRARARFSFNRAGRGFFNPFGGTVVAGSQRVGAQVEMQVRNTSTLRVTATDERNDTDLVSNSRQGFGLVWQERLGERLTATFGYDFRHLDDGDAPASPGEGASSSAAGATGARVTNSHLLTFGIDWRPTDRLSLTARREQNLGEADPTYPDEWVIQANYRLNDVSKVFFSQRLANRAISPISDIAGAGAGFASIASRSELTTGIETRVMRNTSLMGGYRIENGVDGTDGYAVIGLTQRFKISEEIAIDAGYERAFRVNHWDGSDRGGNQSTLGGNVRGYNSLTSGLTWKPRSDFQLTSRYEFRDRDGSGHLAGVSFAGKPSDSITAIGRFSFAKGDILGGNSTMARHVSFGAAYRPLSTDRWAAFVNYSHRDLSQTVGGVRSTDKADQFSLDTFTQVRPRLSLFGRSAIKFSDNSRGGIAPAPTLTYLLQGRGEYRISRDFDFALESRWIAQPATGTAGFGTAGEVGYWLNDAFRFGLGYNFNNAIERDGRTAFERDRQGFYFSATTKFERVFDFLRGKKSDAKRTGPAVADGDSR